MRERDHLVLTAIGPDQIGLVERISAFVTRQACNIEDSKMAVFCGEFAVIILISGDGASLLGIERSYRQVESETGLSITLRRPLAKKAPKGLLPYRLTASCMDHPGIVSQISGALSDLGVNMESMETKTYPAPVSGAPLFQLEATVTVPAGVDIAHLLESFAEIQRTENIDIELSAL
jgi:glycine cleavage system transcriptional repressor